jgi:hypothetical protein
VDILFTLGGVESADTMDCDGAAASRELHKPSVATEPPFAPNAKPFVHFTETIRWNLIVRLFRCECGEVVSDEKPAQAHSSGGAANLQTISPFMADGPKKRGRGSDEICARTDVAAHRM